MGYDNFLSGVTNKTNKILYSNILSKVEQYNKPLESWTVEDVDRYLSDLSSTSLNTIQKHLLSLRKLYKYISKTNDDISPSKTLWEFIDFDKLRSIILTKEDYIYIRNSLDIVYGGETINLRDKVIFELAWSTLTSEEIRLLKENDIEEISRDLVILHLSNRKVNIDDPVVVKDIRNLKNEMNYYIFWNNGKILKYSYKESSFLIKPIAIRLDKARMDIASLSIIFMQIMKRTSFDISRKSIDFDGVDHILNLKKISLEAIRRSKIIYLLSMDVTLETIKQLLDKNQQSDIVWLRKMAKKIYG